MNRVFKNDIKSSGEESYIQKSKIVEPELEHVPFQDNSE